MVAVRALPCLLSPQWVGLPEEGNALCSGSEQEHTLQSPNGKAGCGGLILGLVQGRLVKLIKTGRSFARNLASSSPLSPGQEWRQEGGALQGWAKGSGHLVGASPTGVH